MGEGMYKEMEMWRDIRRRVLVEGESKRQICREYGIHFLTLQKILEHPEPPGYRQRSPREKRKIGPFIPTIEEILTADKKAPRKQRPPAESLYLPIASSTIASFAFLIFIGWIAALMGSCAAYCTDTFGYDGMMSTFGQLVQEAMNAHVPDIYEAFIRVLLFGGIVALSSLTLGARARNPQEVGRCTTNAVVLASLTILITDGIWTLASTVIR